MKAIILISAAFSCLFCAQATENDAEQRQKRVDGLYISHVHRGGGAKERPDNTLETFIWCWSHGAGVECDIQFTKDKVPVMIHDGNLHRTARNAAPELVKTKINQLTYDQIKNVDVGSYIDPRFASERVPTFDAVLKEMQKDKTYLLFVDDKGVGPKKIAEKAKEYGILDQVYYTTCHYSQILNWNKVTGGGKTRLWWGPGTRSFDENGYAYARKRMESKMNELRKNNFKGVTLVCFDVHFNPDKAEPFLPDTAYLKGLAEELHRNGVLFTCIPYIGGNRKEVYHRLWEIGCDGFGSDYPSAMFKAIKEIKDAGGRCSTGR